MLLLAGLILASLFPIWRDPVVPGGRSTWEFYRDTRNQPHIPYDQAVTKAREAYCECSRIGRRAC